MMCYYLKVHFQGQRLKTNDRRHTSADLFAATELSVSVRQDVAWTPESVCKQWDVTTSALPE
jgi:hypothetical protein